MNRLKELRERRGWNMRETAKALGIPYTTYVSYEKEDRQLYSEPLVKIAKLYDVPVDYILCHDTNTVQIKPPIVQKYERLDEISRKVVDTIIELELLRQDSAKVQSKVQKVVPLFVAAAGPGEPVDEFLENDEYMTDDERATFAVTVSGDSMLPLFNDGDIAICRPDDPQAGDIAVVMVNGFLLVKQFLPGYNGQFYLRSLNRARAALDYDFIPSGNDTVKIWGKVLCDKIPLVQP